jgi:hypothetical protein
MIKSHQACTTSRKATCQIPADGPSRRPLPTAQRIQRPVSCPENQPDSHPHNHPLLRHYLRGAVLPGWGRWGNRWTYELVDPAVACLYRFGFPLRAVVEDLAWVDDPNGDIFVGGPPDPATNATDARRPRRRQSAPPASLLCRLSRSSARTGRPPRAASPAVPPHRCCGPGG